MKHGTLNVRSILLGICLLSFALASGGCKLDDNRLRGHLKQFPGSNIPDIPDIADTPDSPPPPPFDPSSEILSLQLRVDTDLSPGSVVTLPLRGDVDVLIHWGSSEANQSCPTKITSPGNISCPYPDEGEYLISIKGTLSQFGSGSSSYPNADKILAVERWGDLGIQSLSGAFYGAKNLASVPPLPENIVDISYMFYQAESFNQDINEWDVSQVTDMTRAFAGARTFNQPLENWNVSQVTSMAGMFSGAENFDQELWFWNVGAVSNMDEMFLGASSFNRGINCWDVKNIGEDPAEFLGGDSPLSPENLPVWGTTDCPHMMTLVVDTSIGTNTTVTLPLRGTVDVKIHWGHHGANSTCTRTYTSGGDRSCTYPEEGLFKVRISGTLTQLGAGDQNGYPNANKIISVESWGDLGLVHLTGAFRGASNLIYVPPIPSTVRSTAHMFRTAMKFNSPVNHWDVSQVTNMSHMFYHAEAFDQPVDQWDTSGVVNMSGLFRNAVKFNQPLSSWDLSSVTSMASMFSSAASFNQPLDAWDVSGVTSMSNMFIQAYSFNQPIGNWDIRSVTNLSGMFSMAHSFNQDLTCWDVSAFPEAPSGFNFNVNNRPVWGTSGCW